MISVTFNVIGSPYCLQIDLGDYRQSFYYGVLCDKQTIHITTQSSRILFNITYNIIGEYILKINATNYISQRQIQKTIIVNNKPCFPAAI